MLVPSTLPFQWLFTPSNAQSTPNVYLVLTYPCVCFYHQTKQSSAMFRFLLSFGAHLSHRELKTTDASPVYFTAAVSGFLMVLRRHFRIPPCWHSSTTWQTFTLKAFQSPSSMQHITKNGGRHTGLVAALCFNFIALLLRRCRLGLSEIKGDHKTSDVRTTSKHSALSLFCHFFRYISLCFRHASACVCI